jgi:small subunit ribosomal protein S6
MADPTAYDLIVLIDPEAPEERRTSIVEGVKKQVSGGDGTLKGDVDWGVRRLAFEIEHRPEAHYHLFQLEAAPELLQQIRHNLAIDDGVLRHRLIRLDKGAPDKPPAPPPASRPARRAEESEETAEPAQAEDAPAQAEEPPAQAAPAPAQAEEPLAVEQPPAAEEPPEQTAESPEPSA